MGQAHAVHLISQSIKDFHHRQLARVYERALGYFSGLGQKGFGLGHFFLFSMFRSKNFDATQLLGHEGGYVNDPKDPGGETKWGASKRSYPNLDIKNLSREQAKVIYRRDFWYLIHAERLYDGVAFRLFDFAVNSGIQTAIRYYQHALGVADDGQWGPVSQAAADKATETDQILLINAERLDFMTRLKNWPDHGRGWARRISLNLRLGAEDS